MIIDAHVHFMEPKQVTGYDYLKKAKMQPFSGVLDRDGESGRPLGGDTDEELLRKARSGMKTGR